MDIRTKKKGDKYSVTATEGKGSNRVTVTAVTDQRESSVRVAIHGCYELARELRELEEHDNRVRGGI